MPDVAIIVPCRLESTRFPRKLLHSIAGKPLVLWVAGRIKSQAPEFPLFFAVDDELLRRPLAEAGFQVVMTRADHASGTDRLAEANRTVQARHVINVQADEPLVSGRQIRALAEMMRQGAPASAELRRGEGGKGQVAMATMATPFQTAADFQNPNQVKVVLRLDGRALYFSRSPIPFPRDVARLDDAWVAANPCLKHLGLYAYSAELLGKFSGLPQGRYELKEKLEQLRVLENGFDIQVGITDEPSIGIDTPEDAVQFAKTLTLGKG